MLETLSGVDALRVMHIDGPECVCRLEFARKLAVLFGLRGENIRGGSLRESRLTRPAYLCIDSTVAQKALDYRVRTLKKVR
jgi:dTDP-4-dehydrorhamnose reductase